MLSESDRQMLLLNLNCMRMVCDSTYILNQNTNHGNKIAELKELLSELLQNEDNKIVIFSQWKRMFELVIKELEKMLPSIENEKVELLLKAILQDEERHHKLLKTLYEILIRGEAVTEGDWWDAVWGDVPGLWG